MAVAVFGTVGTGTGTDTDPFDHSHTIASGSSDVILVAGTEWADIGGTLSSVIWDPTGDNQTLTEDVEGNNGFTRAALSHYIAPANQDDTSYTLRHDFSQEASDIVGGGLNLSGVDQTTPTSNATSEQADAQNPNVTVTTNADGDDLVVDSVAFSVFASPTLTVDGSQTERWNLTPSSTLKGGASTEGGGTDPTEMDWSTTGSVPSYLAAGMLINAAAAGGGGAAVIDHTMLLGVG